MKQVKIIHITLEEFNQILHESLTTAIDDLKDQFRPKNPTEYLTRHEVAKLLKVDITSVHNYTKRGLLKAHGISGRVLYKREEVEQAVQN